MLEGRRVLAVVPARSGSKGIPGKNLRQVGGLSLIARAGRVLAALPWLDARVLSTDSPEYAAEGERHGLAAPFLRPPELCGDAAGAVETLQHAVREVERLDGAAYDVVLIVEPTSPLRRPGDVERATRLLLERDADSVVCVSPLDTKSHPRKLLTVHDGRLGFFASDGAAVKARQELTGGLYWRNGICYALSRRCLMDEGAIITARSVADVIERPVANIDEPIDLLWAEFLLRHEAAEAGG